MTSFSRLLKSTVELVSRVVPTVIASRHVHLLGSNRLHLYIVVLLATILFGSILSHTVIPSSALEFRTASTLVQLQPEEKSIPKVEGTVDEVPPRFQFGQQLYLETCATCHVGIPPAVMPTQTWVDLLDDTQHYGVQIPLVVDPQRLIIWQYLEQFSRARREDERTPYRVRNSRFFKVLHPKVEFDEPVRLTSCLGCHPGAPDFNYRQLTPEWEDAP